MKVTVVFESMFGNTEVVARAIAKGLEDYGSVTVLDVAHAPPLEDTDLVVVGGPTHAFGMTRASTRADAVRQGADAVNAQRIGIREWIETMPAGNHLLVATFDTRVPRPRLPGSAAREALRRLKRLGLQQVASAETFWVDGVKGPLRPGEEERARQWGARIGEAASLRVRPPGDRVTERSLS